MESDYLFGAIVASLLTVIFLFRSRAKKAKIAVEAAGDPLASTLEAEVDGSSGEGADIIVVGAGVAGSALAYTLAKVKYVLSISL